MANSDAELLDQIVNKVIEIDHRRMQDKELKGRIQDHIAALSETTSLSQGEIEAIALDVCAQYRHNRFIPRALLSLPKPVYAMLALLLAVGVVWLSGQYFGYQKGVMDVSPVVNDQTENRRSEFIKKYLTHAVAKLNTAKLIYLEDYMATGRFPTSLEQVGYTQSHFTGEYITGVEFLPDRQIKAQLSDVFGADKYLLLQTAEDTLTGKFEWACFTNIPQKYLGAKSASVCDFHGR